MAIATPKKNNDNGSQRTALIKGIDNPLGFFVLALHGAVTSLDAHLIDRIRTSPSPVGVIGARTARQRPSLRVTVSPLWNPDDSANADSDVPLVVESGGGLVIGLGGHDQTV